MGLFICSSQKMSYLCTRIRQLVPWMSGLVSGLQNHVRRFESARYLKRELLREFSFFVSVFNLAALDLYYSEFFLSCSFVARKNQSARHTGKISHNSLCSQVASDIPRSRKISLKQLFVQTSGAKELAFHA